MNLCSRLFLTAGLLAVPLAHAGVIIVSDTLVSGGAIGDAPSAGLARILNVSTSDLFITDVTIDLNISSLTGDVAWNGDLYAQLTGPSGSLSVLLNRTGLAALDDPGYGNSGFSITISDSTGSNVHTYQDAEYDLNGSGQLTGTWQSDGRTDPIDPTRDRPLSQFIGQNPSGDWTLLIADRSNGNRAQLDSWTITLNTTPVPEPGAFAVLTGLGLLAVAGFRRRRSH